MEYLLKASAVIAIFYVFYKLLLQRDTFFKHNRWFLLTGLLVALTIPMVVIPIYIEYTPIDMSNFTFENVTTAPVNSGLDVLDYAMIGYGLGLLFFFIRFIFEFTSLALVIIKNKKTKQSEYTYVETQTNISPFSFFKWIVYNPEQFNETELDQIIIHEKVHANQYHSIDVLLTHIACIALWFNPFIWFYSKIIKQNLEFIADQEAQQKFSCKKSYQTTLLKTSISSHQMTLSNNFYNSLIKKRIVMLHKSKSKKINQIKYVLVIPLLALFLMSFNTEEIYIEKEKLNKRNALINTSINQSKIDTYHILDNFKDKDFEELKTLFETKGYILKISNLKRVKGLITAINVSVKNESANANFNTASLLPIKAIKIVLDKENNTINIRNLSDTDLKVVAGFPSQEKVDAYKDSKKLNNLIPENDLNKALFVLDGNIVKQKDIQDLNADDIKSMAVLKGKKAIEKYGDKGKNGAIEIISKSSTSRKKTLRASGNGSGNIPLYILNDEEVTQKMFEMINPDDIKEMKALKGAKAIEKYGDKGKDGAIEITTKWKTKFIIGKPMDSIKVIGYLKSQDSSKAIEVKSPWKVSKGTLTEEKDNSNLSRHTVRLSSNNKTPIFILDGKEVDEKVLESLNNSNISSVNVLKVDDAIKKYGEKGKNGVVEISSKSKSEWKVTAVRNENVIYATKDTIYVKKQPSVIKDLMKTFKGDPLILLDGKEITLNELSSLKEQKIESIRQINSEHAIKQYGKRAKNGALILTLRTTNSKTPNIKIVGDKMYIVDGKLTKEKDFLKIHPDNIKSMSVLKGDAAIKKYGDKAKDGVIEIITKE